MSSTTCREKVSTFGRSTTISCGTFPSTNLGVIFILTVCNLGEAFRKLSRHKALSSSFGHDDSSNVVRFGKIKWLKREGPL